MAGAFQCERRRCRAHHAGGRLGVARSRLRASSARTDDTARKKRNQGEHASRHHVKREPADDHLIEDIAGGSKEN